MAQASYPAELLYHPEHDWARIEGDDGDVRDHLVRPGRARRGRLLRAARASARSSTKDEPYTEVESVKAVSDVIAPLSGEIIEVNDGARRRARGDQRGPLRRGLAGQGAPRPTRPSSDALLDADAYVGAARRGWLREQLSRYTAVTDADLRRRCSRRSASARSRSSSRADPGRACASAARSTLPARAARERGLRAPARARRAQPQRRGRAQLPRRGHVRPLRPGAGRHADASARSS